MDLIDTNKQLRYYCFFTSVLHVVSVIFVVRYVFYIFINLIFKEFYFEFPLKPQDEAKCTDIVVFNYCKRRYDINKTPPQSLTNIGFHFVTFETVNFLWFCLSLIRANLRCTELSEFSGNFAPKSEIISTSVCFIRDRANWISSWPEANFKLPVELYITLLI